MFKRMSVLVRRPDQDRSTFSRLWEKHAAPVSQLPRVRGYVQNHIEEDFNRASPIAADGFVELLWDRPEDMAAAFASAAAQPMVADEPGFLGHGSGYALAGTTLRFDASAVKLVVAVLGDADAVEAEMARVTQPENRLRDDVTSLIAKPGMAPPQRVDTFFHLWFPDATAARTAATALVALGDGSRAIGVYRVRTIRFV